MRLRKGLMPLQEPPDCHAQNGERDEREDNFQEEADNFQRHEKCETPKENGDDYADVHVDEYLLSARPNQI